MQQAHEMSAMLWSMGLLGTMPFVLMAVGAFWYFRTQRPRPSQSTKDHPTD
ncbi:MAG: hypothetical protein HY700_08925 [Gemmatimonadetes bacterium]|nr:hypothetical protein [Gemmatimonadota bacterium]